VANIPYYLTSNLIRVLSESANSPAQAALLVQKEVAERVAARPGGMSLLSVSAQFYWDVSLGRVVPAELFTPPPKVDSQILTLQYRKTPMFQSIDARGYFRIVKAGYVGRRKTLHNSLSAGLQLSKPDTAELLAAANIAPTLRAQNLTLDDWHRLYEAYKQIG
jgi:16S rRNA (adenine1518-N6/adenine1519-N6)-dimethyltransferase